MLLSLKVDNYAIIDHLEIQFDPSLNIITGETGAGKSILMGALGLILGNRADTKVLFDLKKKCIVEAEFGIKGYQLHSFFEENELDYQDPLIIRREILPSAKSRAFINDVPTTVKVLRDLSNRLIDLHQQFDTLGLNNEETQLNLLDAYAGNLNVLNEYQELFETYEKSVHQLRALERKQKKVELEYELLQYQLKEFEELNLEQGQIQELEEEQKVLENAESIITILKSSAFQINENEQSIVSSLREQLYELNKVSDFNQELQQVYSRFFDIIEELDGIGSEFEDIAARTELNPNRLEEVQAKLNMIYQVQSKHKIQSEEALFEKWEEIADRINAFSSSGREIQELKISISGIKKKLDKFSENLRNQRKKNSGSLCKKVEKNLEKLSMDNAQFEILFEELEDFGPSGKDIIKFVFTANKGARLQEIKEVASGGELSRLSLCIKSELAKFTKLPTLIFDEIDSGVSGEISKQMGNMIKALSSSHQIINITHSPQIASKADKHFRIFKENDHQRSFTRLEILEMDGKLLELAKMLSGNPPSEAAKENARSLIEEA